MNEIENIITFLPKEFFPECKHVWATLGEDKCLTVNNRTWIIKNYECQKCFCLRQRRDQIR